MKRSWGRLAVENDVAHFANIEEKKVKREFTVVIERDEDGYFVGTVPALKGCHTQAKSLDEMMERMKEAVQLCLEAEDRLAVGELAFVGVQRIAV